VPDLGMCKPRIYVTVKTKLAVFYHFENFNEDFILPYSAVYLRIQKCKNYRNRSTFANVIVKIKVTRFLWPMVYTITLAQ